MPWRSSKASPLASAYGMRWRWKRRKVLACVFCQVVKCLPVRRERVRLETRPMLDGPFLHKKPRALPVANRLLSQPSRYAHRGHWRACKRARKQRQRALAAIGGQATSNKGGAVLGRTRCRLLHSENTSKRNFEKTAALREQEAHAAITAAAREGLYLRPSFVKMRRDTKQSSANHMDRTVQTCIKGAASYSSGTTTHRYSLTIS